MKYITMTLLTLVSITFAKEAEQITDKEKCSISKAPEAPKVFNGGNERCYFAQETGECRAAHPGYYFNWKTRTCQGFIHGGCHGCKPFDTMEACQKGCFDILSD